MTRTYNDYNTGGHISRGFDKSAETAKLVEAQSLALEFPLTLECGHRTNTSLELRIREEIRHQHNTAAHPKWRRRRIHLLPDNTSIVVIDKPLSMLQRKILEADLTGQFTSQTSLAKAVGCDRQSVVKAQQLSTYLESYNSSKAVDKAQGINLKKHTISELKVAMSKLQELVKQDKSLMAYGVYVKLCIDVLKGTVDIDLDTEQTDVIDETAIMSDLISLMVMAQQGNDPEELALHYCKHGTVPTTSIKTLDLPNNTSKVCKPNVVKDGNL